MRVRDHDVGEPSAGRWRKTRVLALALGACSVTTACDAGRDEGEPASGGAGADAADALLTPDRVHALHLELDAAAMAALAGEPRKYVEGRFLYEDRRQPVGVRFKGHRTLRSWAQKPSFKVNFARVDKNGRLMGLREIVLNNMVEDPTLLRETLAYEIARALGVPAPRTGFAEVFVNDERFGLYTIVEPEDERFLQTRFGDASGPLYEGEYGCDFYPGDAESMELDEGKDPDRAHIRALAQVVASPGDALFDAAGPLDVPALQRFLAVSTMIGDFDGYRHAHNYRAYFDPKRERWQLLLWGLDRTLKKHLTPFDSHGVLARRCFADAGCRRGYVARLHALAGRFQALQLPGRLDALDAVIAEAVARDPRLPHSKAKRKRELDKTRRFLRARPARIRKALACWNGERELDRDRDGHGCDDCDDADPAVHPGAAEACNGVDDDCSGLVDDAPACPCPEELIGEQRFALCDLAMSWEEAARFCEQRGGHLARIRDAAQSRALYEAAEALRDEVWWIGLNDREREGRLAWHDGAPVRFTHWAKGEPDPYACGQDCAALKKGARGKWRDMHCATPRPFICELPPKQDAGLPQPAPSQE